jgi:uncharacterized protein GlcG (DUF336 family)
MRPILLAPALLLAAAVASPALPQSELPPPAERAPGPALTLAVEAAQAAIATCLGNGYKTTALVTDSAGVPVAMLAADGASERTQIIATNKVATVVRYGVASGVIADRVANEPDLAAEVQADPKISGRAWRGALPIMKDGEILGVLAVSGAPGGDKDEVCVQAGLDAIAGRLG